MKKNGKIKLEVVFQKALEVGFTAIVPSLPGCISVGETLKETKKNILEAVEIYLEDLNEEEKSLLRENTLSYVKETITVNG